MERTSLPKIAGRDKAKKAVLRQKNENRLKDLIDLYSSRMTKTLAPMTLLAMQQKEQNDLAQIQMGLSMMRDSLHVLRADSHEYKNIYSQYTALCEQVTSNTVNLMKKYTSQYSKENERGMCG